MVNRRRDPFRSWWRTLAAAIAFYPVPVILLDPLLEALYGALGWLLFIAMLGFGVLANKFAPRPRSGPVRRALRLVGWIVIALAVVPATLAGIVWFTSAPFRMRVYGGGNTCIG
ncbi:MAG: hypothetical protein OER88_10690 [Planctomycetota bacterium]|nr:hypothetical protein [Planctomycetota bacterium]